MTTAIIYHKSDLDGIGSAAIAIRLFPDAQLYPAEYNQERYVTEDFEGKDVIILDFCPQEIEKIKEVSKSFVWCDHHLSAKQAHPELWQTADGTRDENYSAIYLTWEFFFPEKIVPKAVELIQDYDIWKFVYGDQTKAFHCYAPIQLLYPDSNDWEVLLFNGDAYTDSYVELGKILLAAKKDRVSKCMRDIVSKSLWGFKVGFVNTNHDISDVGHDICERGHDVGVVWRMVEEGYIVLSFRSINIDVSEIAKSLGGGGHKYASACQMSLDKFVELLK